jgi:hypothetical protein
MQATKWPATAALKMYCRDTAPGDNGLAPWCHSSLVYSLMPSSLLLLTRTQLVRFFTVKRVCSRFGTGAHIFLNLF